MKNINEMITPVCRSAMSQFWDIKMKHIRMILEFDDKMLKMDFNKFFGVVTYLLQSHYSPEIVYYL
jgi:hypothetical protein